MSAPPPVLSQRIVVGVGDCAVSNLPGMTLSTYALGSCVGIVGYDPRAMVGGMLHFMLPDARLSPEKARAQPGMFASTGIPLFFRSLRGLRADFGHLRLFVAGGASVLAISDTFKIGARNLRAAEELLAVEGFEFDHGATGGTMNRTLHLEIGSGDLTLKTPTAEHAYSLLP
jgi:chemotaxis protein CheD